MNERILDLTPTELSERRAIGELWCLLDVREGWELELAQVADCLHIPMREVPQRLDELDKNEAIAVLCHSGGRSARVAQFLLGNGFSKVANIKGGIDAWSCQLDASIARY